MFHNQYKKYVRNPYLWVLLGSTLALSLIYFDQTQNGPKEVEPDGFDASLTDCGKARYSGICHTTQVKGESVRYGLSPGSDETTVLVDTGGPGLSVLNDHFPADLREELPKELKNANLVFIEERWVTKPLTVECKADVKEYYSDLRSNDLERLQSRATETTETYRFVDSCDLPSWSWTPSEYVEAVTNIEKENGIDFDGFIGFSFGTNRYEYLQDTQPFEWAWLLQPAPPSREAESFISNRSKTLIQVLQENCEVCASPDTFESRFNDALVEFDDQTVPLPDRSLEVTRFDLLFLVYGLGNTNPELWGQVPEILDDPSSHSESIAALSDSVWSRIGSEGLSPAHLGYLSEVCSYYQNWETVRAPSTDTGSSFWLLHRPCVAVGANGDLQTETVQGSETDICIAGSTQDPISSIESVQELSTRYENPTVKINESLGHDSTAALSDCARFNPLGPES